MCRPTRRSWTASRCGTPSRSRLPDLNNPNCEAGRWTWTNFVFPYSHMDIPDAAAVPHRLDAAAQTRPCVTRFSAQPEMALSTTNVTMVDCDAGSSRLHGGHRRVQLGHRRAMPGTPLRRCPGSTYCRTPAWRSASTCHVMPDAPCDRVGTSGIIVWPTAHAARGQQLPGGGPGAWALTRQGDQTSTSTLTTATAWPTSVEVTEMAGSSRTDAILSCEMLNEIYHQRPS